MAVKVKTKIVTSLDLAKRLPSINKALNKAVETELIKGTLAIYGEAYKSIQQRKGTRKRVYFQGKTQERLVSDPGQPPNTQTANLVRSLTWAVDGKELLGQVGSKLNYGAILELTTNPKLSRPWLRPAFKKHIEEIRKNIRAASKAAFERFRK